MRKLWFNPAAHLMGVLLLAMGIGGMYLLAHDIFRPLYTQLVRKSARMSFQAFRYERSPDGRGIILDQGGNAVSSNLLALAKAPFDLQKLPTFQGVINRHLAITRQINAYYLRQRELVLTQFRDDGGTHVSFPVGALDGSITEFAQITREEYQALANASLDQFAEVGLRILPRAMSYDPANIPPALAIETTDELSKNLSESLEKLRTVSAPIVKNSLSAPAIAAIQRAFGTQTSNLVEKLNASLAVDAISLGDADGNKPTTKPRIAHDTLLKQFLNYFATGDEQPRGEAATSRLKTIKGQDLDTILDELSVMLAGQFDEIVLNEAASFWLLGRFRWWEIICWVWFGVLVRNILDFSQIALGTADGKRFEPRDSFAVLAQLAYAPMLTLAVIFLAGYFEVAGLDLGELGRSTPTMLGLAFVFGIFPNITWGIIRNICTTFFSRELHEAPRKPSPTHEVVKVTTPIPARSGSSDTVSPTTVEQLKRNVASHVTAVLKPGSS